MYSVFLHVVHSYKSYFCCATNLSVIFTESSEATYYIVRSITGENLHTIEWNFE